MSQDDGPATGAGTVRGRGPAAAEGRHGEPRVR